MKHLYKTLIKALLFVLVLTSFAIPIAPNNFIATTNEAHKETSEWILIAENVEATVYNAVLEQCDGDPLYTASMFRLNLDDVYSHRIIAMENTFRKSLGLKFGDVVKVEGAGKWDGVWQIQDSMNPRFAGRKKIDFLVPENIKYGKWNTVKIYCLTDKENTTIYKNNMAPQAKKKTI